MKQEWIARAKRFATYALVGCFDTGMDWVAFTTAHELLHFTPVICQAIGYFVGTVCSYFLNGRITFRDGHIARWRQCLRFVMWNVVSLGVSEVMIGLLTHLASTRTSPRSASRSRSRCSTTSAINILCSQSPNKRKESRIMTDRQLINLAEQASRNAYVPYSHFAVGAALECRDGTVFTGCNIENAALGSTICAERTAACKAVSEGRRDFVRIAVYGDGEHYCYPCGACRQFLAEFAPDMEVLSVMGGGRYVSNRLSELMPYTFNY